MKRQLAVAALLASTALTPTPARAGPAMPFISGLFAGIGVAAGTTGAVTAGIVGGAFGAGFATASFLTTTLVGKVLLSVGLSYISKALTRTPQPQPSDRMVNFSQPLSYAETVLGRTRKGGPLGFTGFKSGTDVVTGKSGAKRHYSPILAMHSCKGVVEHWLGDKVVEIDADGSVTTEPFAGHYRIRPFTGAPGQLADAELVARFSEITSAHDFVGLCGAHIWAARVQDDFTTIYPDSRQADYAPVLDGHDGIYDPRDDSFKWTRNAGLILAFWITRILGQQVDWDEVAEEADAADLLVTKRGGAQIPRWQIDGTLSDDQEFEDQRAQLAAACDAWLYERADGKVGFKLGRWIEPAFALTDRDFFSLEVSQGQSGSGAPNKIAVRYTEPANDWKESTTADLVFDPDGPETREDPQLYMVSEHNQAFRMARRLMAVKRPPLTIRGTIGIAGYWLRSKRFWKIDHAIFGEMYVEVQKLERNEGGWTFDVEATATSAADFEPEVSDIEPERPAYQRVASDDTVPDLLGLSAVAENGGAIRWTWTAPDDEALLQRIRLRKSGDSDWQIADVPPGQASFVVTGLAAADYESQAVNVTAARRQSDAWQPEPALVTGAIGNTTAPAPLDSFDVTAAGPDVVAAFVAPNDPNYFATRIWRADYATGFGGTPDFADAALVRTEYGIPSAGDDWTDVDPAEGLHAYWAAPINGSGVEGPRSGPATITTA